MIDPSLQAAVEQFLYHEAELLDDNRLEEWLQLLADDVDYRAPVVTTRRRGDAAPAEHQMFWFEDNLASLRLRVRRLGTDVAWAEDPPSRTRRLVGNVRVQSVDGSSTPARELEVKSNLLVFRNRGADAGYELAAAERHDRLRTDGDGWRLVRRVVHFDQATLGLQNLAIFF